MTLRMAQHRLSLAAERPPGRTTLYLIRHGEVGDERYTAGMYYGPDARLGENGRNQAKQIGERIARRGERIEAIYTSPLDRTTTTAQLVAEGTLTANDPIYVIGGLAEADAPGWIRRMLGAPHNDDVSFYGEPHSRETYPTVVNRVTEAIDTIVTMEQRGCAAVVSHHDPILIARVHLEHPSISVPPIDDLIRVYGEIGPGQAFRVVLDEDMRWVETEHLTGSEGQLPSRRERRG